MTHRYRDGTEHTRLVIALCFFVGAVLSSLLFACTPTPTVSPLPSPTFSPISPPATPDPPTALSIVRFDARGMLWLPHSLR